MLAEVGQFPPFFGRGSPLGSHAGLMITSALVLVVANLIDLSAIASVGSACSLAIFLLVGIAGYRRRADTNSRPEIVLAAIAVTAIVLAFFAVDTLRNAPETFTAIVAIALLSVALDFVWKRSRPPGGQPGPAADQRRWGHPAARLAESRDAGDCAWPVRRLRVLSPGRRAPIGGVSASSCRC